MRQENDKTKKREKQTSIENIYRSEKTKECNIEIEIEIERKG